jgi:hypothetical protein
MSLSDLVGALGVTLLLLAYFGNAFGVLANVSSRAASGRLSHLERPVWEFIGYLARRLAPVAAST